MKFMSGWKERIGEEKVRHMNKVFFRDLLDWFMVSDPWPLDHDAETRIQNELDKEAIRRDYKDWIIAYHEMEKDT